ncbi:MAG: flagellar hook-length control protein FliK, partial [Lentisphaeria bacterium]
MSTLLPAHQSFIDFQPASPETRSKKPTQAYEKQEKFSAALEHQKNKLNAKQSHKESRRDEINQKRHAEHSRHAERDISSRDDRGNRNDRSTRNDRTNRDEAKSVNEGRTPNHHNKIDRQNKIQKADDSVKKNNVSSSFDTYEGAPIDTVAESKDTASQNVASDGVIADEKVSAHFRVIDYSEKQPEIQFLQFSDSDFGYGNKGNLAIDIGSNTTTDDIDYLALRADANMLSEVADTSAVAAGGILSAELPQAVTGKIMPNLQTEQSTISVLGFEKTSDISAELAGVASTLNLSDLPTKKLVSETIAAVETPHPYTKPTSYLGGIPIPQSFDNSGSLNTQMTPALSEKSIVDVTLDTAEVLVPAKLSQRQIQTLGQNQTPFSGQFGVLGISDSQMSSLNSDNSQVNASLLSLAQGLQVTSKPSLPNSNTVVPDAQLMLNRFNAEHTSQSRVFDTALFQNMADGGSESIKGGMAERIVSPVNYTQMGLPQQSATGRVQIPVNITFGHPEWGTMMAERTAMITAQNIKFADIQLDPPELGPMQVKVSVNQDQASVTFVSANAQVRDA